MSYQTLWIESMATHPIESLYDEPAHSRPDNLEPAAHDGPSIFLYFLDGSASRLINWKPAPAKPLHCPSHPAQYYLLLRFGQSQLKEQYAGYHNAV